MLRCDTIPDAILTCSQKRSSLKHAETADAWTPVIDAPVIDFGTAVQRLRHTPWHQ